MTEPARLVLQTLSLPEPGLTEETALFVFPADGVALAPGEVVIAEGATADLGTYTNLFDLGLWSKEARLSNLRLALQGQGRVRVSIERIRQEGAAPLIDAELDLDAELDVAEPLGDPVLEGMDGVLALRLTALGADVTLTGGAWTASARAARDISLAISITTYRREAAVARTADRLTAFLGAHPDLPVHVQIVDNGETASLTAAPRLSVYPNPNLGGAGGFARGLAEARRAGATHVLFMDDDASFSMENIIRTVALLRLARDETLTIAGAMISEAAPHLMWENGATFNRACRPRFTGLDLRDSRAVTDMVLTANAGQPDTLYGGWWYFAFPVAAVRHDPFPFFVRGDDVSFSLANPFRIVTPNGVASFQEAFAAKESPLTLYLDVRSHLHHHLVHPPLHSGALDTARLVLWFLLRSLIRMHYETARAILLAWEDVMAGPAFFAENADMVARRQDIHALIDRERWGETTETLTAADIAAARKDGPLWAKATLNGHLLPGFTLVGRHRRVPADTRSLLEPVWGAASATVFDTGATSAYTVRHSKRDFAVILARFMRLALRWARDYRAIRDAHREGYDRLTSPDWWARRLATGQAQDQTGSGASALN